MRALPALLLALLVPACATTRAAQWEHWCVDFDGKPTNPDLARAGDEGWEMVSISFRPPVSQQGNSVGGGATLVGVALVALSERRAAVRAAADRQIQT